MRPVLRVAPRHVEWVRAFHAETGRLPSRDEVAAGTGLTTGGCARVARQLAIRMHPEIAVRFCAKCRRAFVVNEVGRPAERCERHRNSGRGAA